MEMVKKLIALDLRKVRAMGVFMLGWVLMAVGFSVNGAFAPMGVVLFTYVWVITPMSYDELSKSGGLLGTLPVTRGQIVQAKYLYSLMVLLTGGVLSGVTGLIARTVGMMQPDALVLLPVTLSSTGIFLALMLPTTLCLGATRARWCMILLYVVSFAVSGALAGILDSDFAIGIAPPPLALLPMIAVIALIVSYLVTRHFYARHQLTE